MRYLLDTNAWIVYLKGRQTSVQSRLEETPMDRITTCSVVWAELLHGARKYENSAARRERIEKLLSPLENFDFNLTAGGNSGAAIRECARCPGKIRDAHRLE